jgi:signal peptidase I
VADGQYAAAVSGEIKNKRPLWVELPILVVVAVVVAFMVRTFVVQTFYIPSESMENTLLKNDKVLVNKVVYRTRDPRRGEVVVFRPPASWKAETGADDYIKRIVGIGGDHIVCCDAQQRITINGTPLDEDYLFPGDQPSRERFDVTVPIGRIFVLGDHRSDSGDSRFHLLADSGTVPLDRVVGEAFVLFWPFDRARTFSPPNAFAHIPAVH